MHAAPSFPSSPGLARRSRTTELAACSASAAVFLDARNKSGHDREVGFKRSYTPTPDVIAGFIPAIHGHDA
jgi:hypothetical protein